MKFALVLQVLKISVESDKYNLVNGGDIDFGADFELSVGILPNQLIAFGDSRTSNPKSISPPLTRLNLSDSAHILRTCSTDGNFMLTKFEHIRITLSMLPNHFSLESRALIPVPIPMNIRNEF